MHGVLHALYLAVQALSAGLEALAEAIADVYVAAVAIRNLQLLLVVEKLVLECVQPVAHLAVCEYLEIAALTTIALFVVGVRLHRVVGRALGRDGLNFETRFEIAGPVVVILLIAGQGA